MGYIYLYNQTRWRFELISLTFAAHFKLAHTVTDIFSAIGNVLLLPW